MKLTKSIDGKMRYTIRIEYRFTKNEYDFWNEYFKLNYDSLKLRDELKSYGEQSLFDKFGDDCNRKQLKELSVKYNVYKEYF